MLAFPAASWCALDEAIINGPLRFVHPMTVTDPHDLAIVRDRVARKAEPQYSAWLQLMEDADAARAFTPDPPESMTIMGGYEENSNLPEMRAWLWRNASAAYASALAWTFAGENAYAEKAVEVLHAWAVRDTEFSGKDRGLQLGSHFTAMLYAADLLHDYEGWSAPARARFERFWRERCLVHVVSAMMRENNWGDNGLMGALAAAIVFEDEPLARRCLSRLDDYFYGDWKMRSDHRGVFLAYEVERNEGRSGITYTAYGLSAIVQALEMARYLGPAYDWWNRSNDVDADFKGVTEYFFRWNMLGEPFPFYELETGEPNKSDTRFNTLEVSNTRLDLDPRLAAWLKTRRPVSGGTAGPYSTLLKGDL